MPLPKHKISKRRGRLRRSNSYYTMKAKHLATCANCGEKKLPHRVCPHCGFYNGKQVITTTISEG